MRFPLDEATLLAGFAFEAYATPDVGAQDNDALGARARFYRLSCVSFSTACSVCA